MDLHEYPRPANDTGIGVHWSVGFASTIGMGKLREMWLPELKAMGVKWVKIFNHDGAIDFAELLLAEGLMPIVRIYRPSPYPSTLDIRDLVHVDALIRAGVRYFEFNPEPDVDTEWKGGRVPANAIDLVVENVIANLEMILERGGMPAIPAVANGSRWDLVGKIVARGRKDLFNGPVWQAIHNYARNRPLDYPYDVGNQEGGAYTPRFYATVAGEVWGEDAWRGRSLQEVNRLRLDRCSPGATIMDDNACWLAYEYFDARNRRHLGRSIPILSTECGYLVGEDSDPRYPATSPDLHMAQTLEACRVMMGSSHRFAGAPDYYFCTAFWLLGNSALGSSSSWCEHHAWYSDRWGGGTLPIVRALKAEPKVVRRWQGNIPVGARTILHGTVRNAGDRRTLVLEKGGQEIARATLDANSRYVIPDLLPGNYTLRVEDTTVEQPVNLTPGQEAAVVNLDLGETVALSGSTLAGKVRGGAGAVVLLLRTSDGEEWVTMARDDGSFRFVDLPPGFYNVRVQGDGAHVSGIMLDGKNQREVELSVAGWGHTVQVLETTGARGPLVRVRVEGQPGLRVTAHNGDWRSAPVLTGSAAEVGHDTCEIGPLDPGYYGIEVEGLRDHQGQPIKLEAYVTVERRQLPVVEFVYSDLEYLSHDLSNSVIRGRVVGGAPDRPLQVRLTDDQAERREVAVNADAGFVFSGLRAGRYAVEVVGHADSPSAMRADIALDGKNTVAIELVVPATRALRTVSDPRRTRIAGSSVIWATAPDSAGRTAKLTDAVGNETRAVAGADGAVRFDGLVAGVYTLSLEGGYEQSGLIVDGESGLEVSFQPLTLNWEAKVSLAGSMPGYSVVRVEVEGMRGLPVYIWKEDWEGMMRRTGSKPDYGECAAEFSPLGPGHYMVEPEGIGVWADVELTGLEVVWIDFRRKAVPTQPNRVEALRSDRRVAPPPPADAPAPRAWNAPPAPPPRPADAPADEPIFDAEDDAAADDAALNGSAAEDEFAWSRPLASAAAFDFTLPSLTGRSAADRDDDDAADAGTQGEDWDDDFAADAGFAEEEAADTPSVRPAPRLPLCLLIPAPVTDLDDLAALLRFVAAAQPTMARHVDEVPDGCRVLLIGPTLAADWEPIETQLTARGIAFERVTKRLAQAFADESPSAL